jgi:transposase
MPSKKGGTAMDVIQERCAGLDVHQKTVMACVRRVAKGKVTQEVRIFGTSTRELLALSDWLAACGCTHVAMESTGVFWKPVWHVLEGQFELVLANAMHIRNIPGRKSDVKDAQWIADLLAHGLIRGSFVPPAPIQELRDLTRTRKQLVREINRHTLRIQKVLEDANVKITGVISDILGMSGRAILDALVAGETDPEHLVDLTSSRLHASRETLSEALYGRVTSHHRFLLKLHLDQIDAIRSGVTLLEQRMEQLLVPFQTTIERLMTIPGVSHTASTVILAEIGSDMSRFPTAGHLLSWAGLCPRLDESAGKRMSTRTRPGTPWLKTTLVQGAWGAVRQRDSYLHAQFLRLKSRRGPKKAIVAVAASILTAAYYMLRHDVDYRDLGADYFVRRDKAKLARHLVRRLHELGVEVEIRTTAA